ncbi:MAG: DUF4274 domain-containing protein [Candidatus Aminicenantes bacterium]|nr:MAG: DUF4274 domain-containing protein [Candidatus Aminicenantes bacterium]
MKRNFLIGLIAAFFIIGCSAQTNSHREETPGVWKWPKATPEQQQLDSSRLQELVRLIREGKEFPRLHSLLIVRNGYLVVEEYFGGYHAGKSHTLQSVSKSFTSALVGIAIEQRKFKGVDEKVLDFFPSVKNIKNMDDRKGAMRLRDLLTMRTGTDYHERGPDAPHFRLNKLERGWDRFYLNRKMITQPGTHFQYDSGGVILMSSMLKNRSGMHADEFARHHLFKPLQIKGESWIKNKEGHPHTGGGLYLKPRDMAKLGLLYLQNGRWEEKQVVPAKWVKESLKKHVSFPLPRGKVIGYGYLWWIMAPDPKGPGKEYIYAAMGFRAQYIFIIPEHDMVVVVTGDTRSGLDQRKPINFIYTHILPAVQPKSIKEKEMVLTDEQKEKIDRLIWEVVDPGEVLRLVKNLDSPAELYYYTTQYNWDDGLAIPHVIADHPHCDLAIALELFRRSEAFSCYGQEEEEELTGWKQKWFVFCKKITSKILAGDYKKSYNRFDPGLTKAKRARYIKQGIPEIFLNPVEPDTP